ncbi:MAG: UspA protein [Planctomycetaceae bacterium]|nr:UspA protein [Planctomycetaceae bacterium]
MPEVKNILVGIDLSHGDHLISAELSPETVGVVAQATELAKENSSQLTFFAVIDLDPHALAYLEEEDPNALVNLGAQAEQVLAGLVQTAKAQGVITVASAHAFGKSWVELIKQVIRGHHNLLMVGTRKLSGFQRLLLGSTSLKLMRNCPCPVWITKPHVTATVTRVLVADDLTEVGARLVRLGSVVAKAKNAELHVLHALEYPWDSDKTAVDPKQAAYHQKCQARAQAELAAHLACAEAQALPKAAQVVIREDLAENAILKYIENQQIDLLVMATIARSGIAGFLMGNTAERLMPQIECSVLAIKPDDFQSPVTLDS